MTQGPLVVYVVLGLVPVTTESDSVQHQTDRAVATMILMLRTLAGAADLSNMSVIDGESEPMRRGFRYLVFFH